MAELAQAAVTALLHPAWSGEAALHQAACCSLLDALTQRPSVASALVATPAWRHLAGTAPGAAALLVLDKCSAALESSEVEQEPAGLACVQRLGRTVTAQ